MQEVSLPILSIVGWSGAGKTTLLARLLRALTRAGLRVGTAKHHHRATADDRGKDSDLHARAGSALTALAGPGQLALFLPARHPTLADVASLAARAADLDLLIAEGFTQEARIAIRVADARGRRRPVPRRCELLADVDPRARDPHHTPAALARLVLAWLRR